MSDVTVRIPASPAYLQVIRLVAAGLATRLGFTLDEIEDLKIGVDELCAYFTGTQGRDGSIEIRFGVHDDKLEISGVGTFAAGQKVRTDLTEFSKMILDTVSDEASLTQVNGSPTFNLTKTHR